MIRTMTFFLIAALLSISCKDEPDVGEPDLASGTDAASPAGDGTTGSLCWDYCQEARFHCADSGFPISWGGKTCAEVCATYKTNGKSGDKRGDTLQCRFTHVELAGQDPQLHCPHASPDGGGVCID